MRAPATQQGFFCSFLLCLLDCWLNYISKLMRAQLLQLETKLSLTSMINEVFLVLRLQDFSSSGSGIQMKLGNWKLFSVCLPTLHLFRGKYWCFELLVTCSWAIFSYTSKPSGLGYIFARQTKTLMLISKADTEPTTVTHFLPLCWPFSPSLWKREGRNTFHVVQIENQ